MDACEAVEKELQRVITKFNGVHDHAKRMLGDVTKNFEDLKSSIAESKLTKSNQTPHTHARKLNRVRTFQFKCVCVVLIF